MAAVIEFEKALKRLEKIVDDLESGDITLEQALGKYEEGIKLSRACQAKLSEAEKKIEVLSKKSDGSLAKEPFDECLDAETTLTVKQKNTRRKKAAAPEDEEGEGNMLL